MTTSKAKCKMVLDLHKKGERKIDIKRKTALDHKTIDRIINEYEEIQEFGEPITDYDFPEQLKALRVAMKGDVPSCICNYCNSLIMLGNVRECPSCNQPVPCINDYETEIARREKIAIAKRKAYVECEDPDLLTIELMRDHLQISDFTSRGQMIKGTEKTYTKGDRINVTRFVFNKLETIVNPDNEGGPLYRIIPRTVKKGKKGKNGKEGTIKKMLKKVSSKKK